MNMTFQACTLSILVLLLSARDVCAQATIPDPQPPQVAAPASINAEAMAASRPDPKTLIDSWVSAQPPMTADMLAEELPMYFADDVRMWAPEIVEQYAAEPNLERRQRLKALQDALELALAKVSPERYTPNSARMQQFNTCYTDPYQGVCNDRLAGFSVAAANLNDEKPCWKLLNKLQRSTGSSFRDGYLDWWHRHKDQSDKCENPEPARCKVGWCSDGYETGVSFRPAVQLGATFGEGLGFSADDATVAAQFSGSLGARVFFFNDAIDVHTGIGIGTSSSDAPDSGTEAPAGGDTDSKTAAFILFQVGVGIMKGFFGISYIRTVDPRKGGPDPGNGLSLFVDAAAVERLVE